MISSRSLRSGFFDGDRYRFFASCCVIVLPPRDKLAARPVDLERFLQLLEVHAFVLPERRVFGDEHRALQVRRDAAVADPPLRRAAACCPFARASRARSSMNAVVAGFVVFERPDVGQREVGVGEHANSDARTPAIARRRRDRRAGACQSPRRQPASCRSRPRSAHASTRACSGPASPARSRARRAAGRSAAATSSRPSGRRARSCRRADRGPAPISMLNSSSRCLRTAASSTPSGTRTAFSVHSRSPSRGSSDSPSGASAVDQRAMVPLVARPARVEPLFFDDRQRFVQRVDERRRHRVVILAAQPVVLEQREIEVEAAALARAARARAARTRPAPAPTARPGTSACSCSRRRCPTPPTSSGWPPNDVTASTIVSAPCSRAIAASSSHRIQHAGRRFGVDHRHDVGRRRLQLRAAARRDRTPGPTRRRAASPSAP